MLLLFLYNFLEEEVNYICSNFLFFGGLSPSHVLKIGELFYSTFLFAYNFSDDFLKMCLNPYLVLIV